jgi:hypothetical protein
MATVAMTSEPLTLTFDQSLVHYRDECLPARNFTVKTRREYVADLTQLIAFLADHCGLAGPAPVERRHLEGFLAELALVDVDVEPDLITRAFWEVKTGHGVVLETLTAAGDEKDYIIREEPVIHAFDLHFEGIWNGLGSEARDKHTVVERVRGLLAQIQA